MNSAHPIQKDEAGAPGQGAAILASAFQARFPSRLASVTAEVLARLLRGERLTSLDAVAASSTTRLAAVIDYLTGQYGWAIDRKDLAAGCRDGRVAWVREYHLSAQVIANAQAAGGDGWCAGVWQERQQLRTKAPEARAAATRANLRRHALHQPARSGLLDGEGAVAPGVRT